MLARGARPAPALTVGSARPSFACRRSNSGLAAVAGYALACGSCTVLLLFEVRLAEMSCLTRAPGVGLSVIAVIQLPRVGGRPIQGGALPGRRSPRRNRLLHSVGIVRRGTQRPLRKEHMGWSAGLLGIGQLASPGRECVPGPARRWTGEVSRPEPGGMSEGSGWWDARPPNRGGSVVIRLAGTTGFRRFSGARAAGDRGERRSAPCASDFEDALHRRDVLHRASAWEVASCQALCLVVGGRARRDRACRPGEVQELDPASGNK